MLNYEQIKSFATLLEQDQAPVLDEHREIERTAYAEGRHIYSVLFDVALDGTAVAKVHVQWPIMEQLMLNQGRTLSWSASGTDGVHLELRLESHPGVVYVQVLFKDDLQDLWERIHSINSPFPEELSAVGIWAKLYERGVWEL